MKWVVRAILTLSIVLAACSIDGTLENGRSDPVRPSIFDDLGALVHVLEADGLNINFENYSVFSAQGTQFTVYVIRTSQQNVRLIAVAHRGVLLSAYVALNTNDKETLVFDTNTGQGTDRSSAGESKRMDADQITASLESYPHISALITERLESTISEIERTNDILEQIERRVTDPGVTLLSCADCDSSNAPMYGEWVAAFNDLRAIAAQRQDVRDEIQETVAALSFWAGLCAARIRPACVEAEYLVLQLADLYVTLNNLSNAYDNQLAYLQSVTDDLVAWTEECLEENCG